VAIDYLGFRILVTPKLPIDYGLQSRCSSCQFDNNNNDNPEGDEVDEDGGDNDVSPRWYCKKCSSALIPKTLKYGSRRAKMEPFWRLDDEINALMESAGEKLKMASHKVFSVEKNHKEKKETVVEVTTRWPADIQVHRGTDGRIYIVNPSRLLAPDYSCNGNDNNEYLTERLRLDFIFISPSSLSVDTFSPYQLRDEEHIQSLRVRNRELSNELKKIATLLDSLSSYRLVEAGRYLHGNFTNIRYMGKLLSLVKTSHASKLVFISMFFRALKTIIRRSLRDQLVLGSSESHSVTVSKLLTLAIDSRDAEAHTHFLKSFMLPIIRQKFVGVDERVERRVMSVTKDFSTMQLAQYVRMCLGIQIPFPKWGGKLQLAPQYLTFEVIANPMQFTVLKKMEDEHVELVSDALRCNDSADKVVSLDQLLQFTLSVEGGFEGFKIKSDVNSVSLSFGQMLLDVQLSAVQTRRHTIEEDHKARSEDVFRPPLEVDYIQYWKEDLAWLVPSFLTWISDEMLPDLVPEVISMIFVVLVHRKCTREAYKLASQNPSLYYLGDRVTVSFYLQILVENGRESEALYLFYQLLRSSDATDTFIIDLISGLLGDLGSVPLLRLLIKSKAPIQWKDINYKLMAAHGNLNALELLLENKLIPIDDSGIYEEMEYGAMVGDQDAFLLRALQVFSAKVTGTSCVEAAMCSKWRVFRAFVGQMEQKHREAVGGMLLTAKATNTSYKVV